MTALDVVTSLYLRQLRQNLHMTQDMATTRAISGHHESMLSQIEAGTTPWNRPSPGHSYSPTGSARDPWKGS